MSIFDADLVSRFWAKVDKRSPDECWPWMAATQRNGYGAFAVRHGDVRPASRVAWMIYHDQEIPPEAWVLHSCDNPPCVNPDHLRLGSRQDNVDDMVRRRRHWSHRGAYSTAGKSNGRAKIDPAVVAMIRERAASGETQESIARDVPVSRSQVGAIARGESWT